MHIRKLLTTIFLAIFVGTSGALAANTATDVHTPVQANKNETITGAWNFVSDMSHFTTGGILCRFADDAGATTKQHGRVIKESIFNSVNFSNYVPAGQSSNWSTRCVGYVKPAYTELYTFSVTTEEGARLWVAGQKVIDQFGTQVGPQTYTGTINLTANQWVPILIDHWEDNVAGETLSLSWSSPSQAFQVISGSQYAFSGADSAPTTLGTATVMGNLGFGVLNPETAIDMSGVITFRATPAPTPTPGLTYLYTDGTTLKISQNGAAPADVGLTTSVLVHKSAKQENGPGLNTLLPNNVQTTVLTTAAGTFSGTKTVRVNGSYAGFSLADGATTSHIEMLIYRDGVTLVGDTELAWDADGTDTSDNYPQSITIMVDDTPPAGAHTYNMVLYPTNATSFYNSAYLTVDELQ